MNTFIHHTPPPVLCLHFEWDGIERRQKPKRKSFEIDLFAKKAETVRELHRFMDDLTADMMAQYESIPDISVSISLEFIENTKNLRKGLVDLNKVLQSMDYWNSEEIKKKFTMCIRLISRIESRLLKYYYKHVTHENSAPQMVDRGIENAKQIINDVALKKANN